MSDNLHHHLPHLVHNAMHDKQNPKFSAWVLIIVGLLLTPWFIGLPILCAGIWKLCAD